MKNNIKNRARSGSITILIIIVMSVVFLFGLYLYQMFKTDEELATLSYEVFTKEQKLNNDAMIALYKIDNILEESKNITLDYMGNKEYLQPESDVVYEIIHNKLQEDFYSSEITEESYYKMASSLYFYLVNARLENLVNEVPSLSVLKVTEEGIIQYINLEMTFRDENLTDSVQMYLAIGDFPYDVTFKDVDGVKQVTFNKNDTKGYTIQTFRIN